MKILLLGRDGQVGWELQRALAPIADLVTAGRSGESPVKGNLAKPDELIASVRRLSPDVIVNAAAYTAVDKAENEYHLAQSVNAEGPAALAGVAGETGALLVHYSTDYVFSGVGQTAWKEDDVTAPLNAYGRTKLAGEEAIRKAGCAHLIIRTSWVYATRGQNFVRTMLRLASERDRLSIVADQHGSPTGAELIADVTAHMIRQVSHRPECAGTYHLSAGGETSWHGFASHAIERARALGAPIRVASEAIDPISTADFPTPARRPGNSRLDTAKLKACFGVVLPDWRTGVDRVVSELLA